MANVIISKEYSGHMYAGSPYETADSCGNCDGAKCETCKPRWIVEDYSKSPAFVSKVFRNEEDAKEFAKQYE